MSLLFAKERRAGSRPLPQGLLQSCCLLEVLGFFVRCPPVCRKHSEKEVGWCWMIKQEGADRCQEQACVPRADGGLCSGHPGLELH